MSDRSSPLAPRLVAWEVTRACGLACLHCRAEAQPRPLPDELSHAEGLRLLDEIAATGKPIVILTGGDPLLRADVYELAAYGTAWACAWSPRPAAPRSIPGVVRRLQAGGHWPRLDQRRRRHRRRRTIPFAAHPAPSRPQWRGWPTVARRGCPSRSTPRSRDATWPTCRRSSTWPSPPAPSAGTRSCSVPTGRGKAIEGEEVLAARSTRTALRWLEGVAAALPVAGEAHLRAALRAHRPPVSTAAPARTTTGRPAGRAARREPRLHGRQRLLLRLLRGRGLRLRLPAAAGRQRARADLRQVYRESPLFRGVARPRPRCEGKCGLLRVPRGLRRLPRPRPGGHGSYLGEEPFCAYEPRAAVRDTNRG